jgi:hypothetical protein
MRACNCENYPEVDARGVSTIQQATPAGTRIITKGDPVCATCGKAWQFLTQGGSSYSSARADERVFKNRIQGR